MKLADVSGKISGYQCRQYSKDLHEFESGLGRGNGKTHTCGLGAYGEHTDLHELMKVLVDHSRRQPDRGREPAGGQLPIGKHRQQQKPLWVRDGLQEFCSLMGLLFIQVDGHGICHILVDAWSGTLRPSYIPRAVKRNSGGQQTASNFRPQLIVGGPH